MNEPRFTVGSVSGYSEGSIGDASGGSWATVWYVQDSAYGYVVVKRFGQGCRGDLEQRARDWAEGLNSGRFELERAPAAPKTHCKHGHEFTPDNTYITPTTGHRQCRTCRYDKDVRWRRRQQAAA